MHSRVAVLASGNGSNLQALLDDPELAPRIHVVASDRVDAGALKRASDRGVRTVVLAPGDYDSREAFDDALTATLRDDGIDAVLLAGYMRILGAQVVAAFAGRILNVHPSLLPAFPGAHAVRDALEWGVKITGVTVHFVDEQVDHGPIVSQEPVRLTSTDTEATLHARIRTVEHRLFPEAARLLVGGRLSVEGRRVRISQRDSARA